MKKGQIVFVKKVGNAARHRDPEDLVTEEVVDRVGNKYFYLMGYSGCKFCLKKKRDISDYISNYCVYESKKEIDEELEYSQKLNEIRKIITEYGKCSLSFDKVREIFNIISNHNKP